MRIIESINFEELNKEAVIARKGKDVCYGDEYFKKYEKYSQTQLGKAICKFRKEFVEEQVPTGTKILDYGCGHGDLVMCDTRNVWRGFDIMEKSIQRLSEKYDSNWRSYNAICFFDVLEHLKQPENILWHLSQNDLIFISIPLWNGDWSKLETITSWKHWRPGEHFLYCSNKGFVEVMNSWGLSTIKSSVQESLLGRQDIYTYCFKKC